MKNGLGFDVRIKWLSVAGFEIEKNGRHIVTDPCITINDNSPCSLESVEGCDLITLSHAHWDHITDIPALMDRYPDAPLLTGTLTAVPMIEWGNLVPQRVYPMDSNLELDFDWVKVKALFGRHCDFSGEKYSELQARLRKRPFIDKAMGDMQITGTAEYRNYLFTWPDGLKVLIWGNGISAVQKNILREIKPDIAILQATSKHLKDINSFAEFIRDIGCSVMIPHHFDLNAPPDKSYPKLNELSDALKEISPSTMMVIPKHGEWIGL